jgi:competence protein ComEC
MQKRDRMRKLLCLLIALVLLSGCTAAVGSASETPASAGVFSPAVQTAGPQGGLEVHFIDVGQADCIFIRQNDATMLIDAGNNADGPAVVGYLQDQGVQKLDTVIGTHPHEDHIGGLDQVLQTFSVGSLLMPKVSHTSKTFEDVLNAIDQKGLHVTSPVPGRQFMVGDAQCTILAPLPNTYDDLNNYSVVVRITFGDTAFLFTGDAGALSEQEMLNNSLPLQADVLKVGHHGSNYSSTAAFLQAVLPSIAVISVAKDNDYGHPSPETIQRLQAAGATVYQTSQAGTIIAYSDGDSVKIEQ